ncbi:hypothetical protein V5O48_015546 [Marasmius crinis-equi]|uniref:Uncharacterized protein n=1 Tax=Marasmius crinis-equi TaxID=585013 RepID=A0ABR3EUJ5_9AGAR
MSMVRREVLEKWPGASPNRLQVYRSTWPYKSPQAWVFLKLIASIPSISPWLLFGTSAGTSMGRKPNIQVLDYLSKPWLRFRHENWARVDARFLNSWWPGQVGQKSDIGIHLWEGIKNIIPILRDTISLQPFLIILESYPLMITLPLAFPYFYRLYTWMDFDDVNRKLDSFFPRMNPAFFTSLYQTLGIPLTGFGPMFSEKEFIVRIVTNNLKLDREPEQLNRFVEEAREISRANMPKRTRINFTLFFHVGQHLWERGQGIELLDIYKDEWSSYSSSISQNHDRISMGGDERYQLIASFARYINTRLDLPEPSHPRETEPVLVTRKGLEFLRFIHDQIIQHKLYDIARYHRITVWPVRSEREIMKEWAKAMEVIRRLKGLPEDYFVEFPPEGSNDSNQESEATVGKLRELCNGISAFIRKALTRRAEDAPNSQA